MCCCHLLPPPFQPLPLRLHLLLATIPHRRRPLLRIPPIATPPLRHPHGITRLDSFLPRCTHYLQIAVTAKGTKAGGGGSKRRSTENRCLIKRRSELSSPSGATHCGWTLSTPPRRQHCTESMQQSRRSRRNETLAAPRGHFGHPPLLVPLRRLQRKRRNLLPQPQWGVTEDIAQHLTRRRRASRQRRCATTCQPLSSSPVFFLLRPPLRLQERRLAVTIEGREMGRRLKQHQRLLALRWRSTTQPSLRLLRTPLLGICCGFTCGRAWKRPSPRTKTAPRTSNLLMLSQQRHRRHGLPSFPASLASSRRPLLLLPTSIAATAKTAPTAAQCPSSPPRWASGGAQRPFGRVICCWLQQRSKRQ